eukprot:2374452-Pleurochrysis_carterae.AAC.1
MQRWRVPLSERVGKGAGASPWRRVAGEQNPTRAPTRDTPIANEGTRREASHEPMPPSKTML